MEGNDNVQSNAGSLYLYALVPVDRRSSSEDAAGVVCPWFLVVFSSKYLLLLTSSLQAAVLHLPERWELSVLLASACPSLAASPSKGLRCITRNMAFGLFFLGF